MIRRLTGVALATACLGLSSCLRHEQAPDAVPQGLSSDDMAFLDEVQKASTLYYWDKAHPASGLVTEDETTTHIGSNGFALTALCIAAERGWISRQDAAERVLKILDTFGNVAATHLGSFLWIADAKAARQNVYNGGYDLVETAYVCAGGLVCKQYFNGDTETEKKIRDQADHIYRAVQFDAFRANARGEVLDTLAWGCDFHSKAIGDLRITGYNECMIVYILALGSPTHPVPASCWDGWTSTYKWKKTYGQDYFFCPALFTHQYSQCWLDLRHVQDRPTREKGITYFENSRRAALSHMAYAQANPRQIPGYGPVWGLTDCGCPLHETKFGAHGLSWAGGAAPGEDDGTVAVTGAGACLPFTPGESLDFLKLVRAKFGDRIYDRHGFRNGFNEKIGWVDKGHDALNKGAMVLMIENFRSGMVWDLFMRNPEVQEGMKKAGFLPVP